MSAEEKPAVYFDWEADIRDKVKTFGPPKALRYRSDLIVKTIGDRLSQGFIPRARFAELGIELEGISPNSYINSFRGFDESESLLRNPVFEIFLFDFMGNYRENFARGLVSERVLNLRFLKEDPKIIVEIRDWKRIEIHHKNQRGTSLITEMRFFPHYPPALSSPEEGFSPKLIGETPFEKALEVKFESSSKPISFRLKRSVHHHPQMGGIGDFHMVESEQTGYAIPGSPETKMVYFQERPRFFTSENPRVKNFYPSAQQLELLRLTHDDCMSGIDTSALNILLS